MKAANWTCEMQKDNERKEKLHAKEKFGSK
jgi:hypothetical protein